MCRCMPGVLAFDEAVTLPVVWITAHYCFAQAQVQSMQQVLVHAASGGVGLVSLEWVTRARGTAYATAGAIAKHTLLHSCGAVRLSSSRDAAACANLLSRLLLGRRLHSLVNALSNDFLSLSLAMLASRGMFFEIGKNSIWSHGRSFASRPFMGYVAVAVDDGCYKCPGWNVDPWWFNSELRQLSALALTGEVQPLPFECFAFEASAVQAALRLLQRGANIGKVVVRVGVREAVVEKQRVLSLETQPLYNRDNKRGADLGTLVCLGIDAVAGVAVLELRDPQRFNTMGSALGDDMTCAVSYLSRLGRLHALMLQGAGSTFCAGGNPYGSGGPTSLSASSQHLLASVQVCLRVASCVDLPRHSSTPLRVPFRALLMCIICAYLSCARYTVPWLVVQPRSSCTLTCASQRVRPPFSMAIFHVACVQLQDIHARCKLP